VCMCVCIMYIMWCKIIVYILTIYIHYVVYKFLHNIVHTHILTDYKWLGYLWTKSLLLINHSLLVDNTDKDNSKKNP